MYESFYNLILPPFQNTPNSRFFFETEQHREALAKLEYTVLHRRGFAMVTGEIGAGKTTLTRTLLRRLGANVRACLINNTRVTSDQLLRMIAAEFQLEIATSNGTVDKADCLTAMRRFVEREYALGRNVVIIIDEGQCLSIDDFEEIRLLTNLENETDKLVQLLILGQPELRTILNHARLKPLVQRIAMYCHLDAMTFDDMTRYIAYRLVRASKDKPNVDFSREALQVIYERSKGIPRVVNLLCDNALLVGYSRDTHLIDSNIIRRAAAQMLPSGRDASNGASELRRGEEMMDSPTVRGEQELEHGRRL
jgi:general secretion pathway protein A